MITNIKNYLTLIILFLQFFQINCFFDKNKFITQFTKIEDYEEALNKKEFKLGFTIIYSKWCGHCKDFSYRYIIISELFHNDLFFYALPHDINYRKYFNIRGYPTVFFYSNDKYEEYKGQRSVTKLSIFIREKLEKYNCTEIPYSLVSIVYNEVYQDTDRNVVIGYFHNTSNFINSFTSITNNLINKNIDLCYYCTNYMFLKDDTTDQKYKKLAIYQDIKDNEVRSYSRNRGNNSFIFNETQNNNEYNYEKFLFDKVMDLYVDIKNSDSTSLLEKMRDKDFIFFVYNNENIKQKFINIINELNEITFYKNDSLYYYVLFNKETISNHFLELQNDNIYLISNNLLQITIIVDISMIKEKIKENNLKYKNNIPNNEKKQFINEEIIKENNTKINNLSFITDNINNEQIINITNNNINIEKEKEEKLQGININIEKEEDVKLQGININIEKEEDVKLAKNHTNIEKKEAENLQNNNNDKNDLITIIKDESNFENKESVNNKININKNESSNITNIQNNIDNNTYINKSPDEPDIIDEKGLINPYSNSTNLELNESKEISSKIDDISKKNSEIIIYQKNNILNINIDKNPKKINLNNTILTKNENNQKENIEPEKSNRILYILLFLIIFIMIIYYMFTKYLCVGFIKVHDSQIIEFNQSNNKIEII